MPIIKIRCNLQTISPGVQEGNCEIISGALGKQRAKRAPSAYNIHIKDCLGKLKGKGDHRDNFKKCAADYRAKKGK